MSDQKHTEDNVGLFLVAYMPIAMIALWGIFCLLGTQL
jgi:hypothetical protein